MRASIKILLVALGAGVLGIVASLALNGPGPLLGSEAGQRVLQQALSASAPEPPAGTPVAQRGQPIPDIVLPNLDGTLVSLPAAHAGRPLLINVWASWCRPCIEEMPALQRFASRRDEHGVQVVGIALDDAQAVRAFLQQVPVDYPILIDSPGPADAGVQLGNLKGVLPYSVLVAADGRLLKQRVGPFEAGEIEDWATPGQ